MTASSRVTGRHLHPRALSSFLRQQPTSPLVATFSQPPLLTLLLAFLGWRDFHAFLNSCSAARILFRSPDLRDLILARFVPGYDYCLRHCGANREHDIYISIHDLDLFLISQKVALHCYPTHALKSLSSHLLTRQQEEQIANLAALALAHSRIVLLLQSLVHSSSVPFNPESRDHFYQTSSTIRELTFPAPLSYASPQLTDYFSRPRAPARPSLVESLSYRRLSIFKSSHSPSPPPPSEPRSLKQYSWRRSLFHHPRSKSTTDSDFSHFQVKSHRRTGSTGSSASASTPSPRSASRSTTPTATTSSPSSSLGPPSPPSVASVPPIGSSSPHDLRLATSRSRAPVLRVYVPCTDLSDASEGVCLCEEQLIESGLWAHLSTGDIVCNCGYVPAEPEPDNSATLPLPLKVPNGSGNFLSDGRSSQSAHGQKWLIFNGSFLVPYTPSASLPLPLENPLTLPSPFYYSHILPSFPFANPIFTLSTMPAPRLNDDEQPKMTLLHLPTKVPSPHSPNGFAVAKKYMWTVSVVRTPWEPNGVEGEPEDEAVMGDGWCGRWVLEGDGTREGRKVLLDWLWGRYAGPPREWEFVRERSGKGRIWLKLLHLREADGDDDETDQAVSPHL